MFFLVFLSLGCSDKVKLGGKVVFSDDGSPLTVGTVCFEKPGFLARGIITSTGNFEVGSLSQKDGLPPGNYRVYITGAEKIISQNSEGAVTESEPLIDDKYTSVTTSDLEIEVRNSTKRYDLKVDRFKPKN